MGQLQTIEIAGEQFVLVPKKRFDALVREAAAFSPSPLENEAFGDYIHRMRCFLRMKENELATVLETSQAQVSRMESGKPVRDTTRERVINQLRALHAAKGSSF